MRVVDLQLPKRKEYNICMVGDAHIGAKNCDKDAFKATIAEIGADENMFVILMGDLLDSIVAGDNRYNVFEQDPVLPSFQAQVDWLRSVLKPIKHKILGMLEGNHEDKIKKRLGYNFTSWLCEDLGTEYLEQVSLLRLDCRFKMVRILVAHGIGAPLNIGGQLMKLKSLAQNFKVTPEIISVGHYHRLDSIVMPVLDDDLNTKVQYVGFTGSFYRTYINGVSNYASDKWYPPGLLGYLNYSITKDEISCKMRIFP